jgi:ATP-dependent helicase HrpB
VQVEHVESGATLPTRDDLEERVLGALARARSLEGDVLVFLPGKAEIAGLQSRIDGAQWDVLPLHGGLTLDQQSKVFKSGKRRRAVLCTNVAETSVTVPGVGVVIDTGLVRRTRYRDGRGFLALVPVALDSADQRKGRAGRLGPGTCLRLWSPRAVLDAQTPPEIRRESLVPLVLACASHGEKVRDLNFLDAPEDHALEAAESELRALGAIDAEGAIQPAGHELAGLPIDAHLGRLLIGAREAGQLHAMIDLVAALAVGRPLFARRPTVEEVNADSCCDASLVVRAVRGDAELRPFVHPFAVAEARKYVKRLGHAFGVDPKGEVPAFDRSALLVAALRADPRLAHVARRRKRQLKWSNGGTEIDLARESALQTLLSDEGDTPVDAIIVFDTHAVGTGRSGRVLATCASAVSRSLLAQEGLGRERTSGVRKQGGRVVATVQRVYARSVLSEEDREPEGELAREAVAELWLRGSVFKGTLAQSRDRLLARALAAGLGRTRRGIELGFEGLERFPGSFPGQAVYPLGRRNH